MSAKKRKRRSKSWKADGGGRRVLFRAGWQGVKVRTFVPVFMALGAAFLASSYWVFNYATAAGGVPASFEERLMLTIFVVAFGLLLFVGLWIYGRIYVVELAREGDAVVLTTVGPVGLRHEVIDIARLKSGRAYDGRMSMPSRISVNAPWFTLGVEGWRLPLVLDLQAETIDSNGIDQLVKRGGQLRAAALE